MYSPGGLSIGGGKFHEGGDMHSLRGQSMDGRIGSQPISGRSGSQQSQGGYDVGQPYRGGHQSEYYFHSICTNLFTCFFIYTKFHILMHRVKMLL